MISFLLSNSITDGASALTSGFPKEMGSHPLPLHQTTQSILDATMAERSMRPNMNAMTTG